MAHRGVAPVDQAPERHGGSSTSRHRLRRHVGRLPKVPRRGQRRRSPTSPASCTRPSPTRCEGGARNPADAVSPPTATKAQTEWWSVDELRRFLVHAADDELYAAWLLFATTGARTGEVVGLTWTDLDLDHGWMRVDWTLGHVGHRLTWKARPPRARRASAPWRWTRRPSRRCANTDDANSRSASSPDQPGTRPSPTGRGSPAPIGLDLRRGVTDPPEDPLRAAARTRERGDHARYRQPRAPGRGRGHREHARERHPRH